MLLFDLNTERTHVSQCLNNSEYVDKRPTCFFKVPAARETRLQNVTVFSDVSCVRTT